MPVDSPCKHKSWSFTNGQTYFLLSIPAPAPGLDTEGEVRCTRMEPSHKLLSD